MPIIAVSLYPGRTKEQKAAFADAVTEAAVKILKTKKTKKNTSLLLTTKDPKKIGS
jgi:phenylpyruvate tautomerase PptA (4-oxalocrotonate tautomerase family)